MIQELKHKYGPQVHVLDNTYLFGLLAKLCSPSTCQPEINHLVEILYTHLLTVVMNAEFPKEDFMMDTRMTAMHPEIQLKGERIKQQQKVISVNLARAGTYPSHICFEKLHYAIAPEKLRQDHVFAARVTNQKEKVTGADFGSTKIGGDKENAIVIFPDPMGATGNTIVTAMEYYKNMVPGRALKTIALHLIVTPEYLKKVTTAHPDVIIYAIRLDRGMSSAEVLQTVPGTHWEQEKGLNHKDYIVPGGGGFGEIMNNSFV